jgi:hypothetical protein
MRTTPYVPKELAWPTKDGKSLAFLMQLRFSEINGGGRTREGVDTAHPDRHRLSDGNAMGRYGDAVFLDSEKKTSRNETLTMFG